MERIHSIFISLFLLSVAIYPCLSDFFISEQKHPNYTDYKKAMEQYSERMKDFEGFSLSQMDNFEIISEADSHCKWITKVETPYSITNGSFEYPVVQTENFQQKIKTTRCLDMGQRCGEGVGLEQFNITMKCKEKYEKIVIYFYDILKEKVRFYYVHVPVCCLCGVTDI